MMLTAVSKPRQNLARLINEVGFGSLHRLPIQDGEPNLSARGFEVTHNLVQTWETPPFKAETTQLCEDYLWLFSLLNQNRNCCIFQLEVWRGRPVRVLIEECAA